MDFMQYIEEVKRKLIAQYGFPENPEMRNCVLGEVPDGDYPMEIDGRTDYVQIKDGKIRCGNFKKP